jgi:DNA-binding LacI/PurR family transcriptional regulator
MVLNRSRTGTRVSPATRARIMEAAESLHYTPNALARSLRQQKTHVIAFYNAQNVVFKPTYPFYAAILSGIQDGCTEFKKDLLIHANFAGRSDDDIFLGMHNGQIDGLVLYVRSVTPLVERLVASHLPVVTVAEEVPGVPYVGIDEVQGGKLLAQHLASKGYKRVLYRSVDEEVVPLTQQERMNAFCEEAAALGMSVQHSRSNPRSHLPSSEEERLLMLPKEERPEVVACWGDVSADGLAAWCIEKGLKIPGDFALTGFDGLTSTQRPSLNLTTIRAPWPDVARTAVGLLAARCEGQDVPERTILPVELLAGDTT